MKRLKIVTIGGGSSYTPELIEGFIIRNKELPIGELWLVDIEDGKEKLNIVGAMAKRMIKSSGLPWEVYLSLNRREALKDADFVTTQFRVGMLDARIRDERMPLYYGMMGQETNGAGGIMKAFRTIPVILDIIKDMQELCPNAWLINFTNPAGMVTEAAITVGGYEKTIGLCNVPILHVKACNEAMGLPLDSTELTFHFAGINHFHFHRVWDKNNVEVTDKIIDEMYNPKNSGKHEIVKNIQELPLLHEQIKDLKTLPCVYHRYYYITESMLNDQLEDFKNNTTRAELVKKTERDLFELYKDPNLDYKPKELLQRGGAYYSDAACEIITSIVNNKQTQMVVSTKNNGALSDVDDDRVVEVSAIITNKGARPLAWGKFNFPQKGALQTMKAMEALVIEAAVTGDYNRALQAFTLNPLIQSGPTSKQLLDEMLVANEEYLPQFSKTIQSLKEKGVKYIPR